MGLCKNPNSQRNLKNETVWCGQATMNGVRCWAVLHGESGRTWPLVSRVRKDWHSILKNCPNMWWRAYTTINWLKLRYYQKDNSADNGHEGIWGFGCEGDEISLVNDNKFWSKKITSCFSLSSVFYCLYCKFVLLL